MQGAAEIVVRFGPIRTPPRGLAESSGGLAMLAQPVQRQAEIEVGLRAFGRGGSGPAQQIARRGAVTRLVAQDAERVQHCRAIRRGGEQGAIGQLRLVQPPAW